MSPAVPAASAGSAAPVITPRAAWAWPLLIFLFALLLRAAAARGDFWLDEIWSWMAVRDRVHGAADVFLRIRHDNNHILNSLWIHTLGLDVDWHWYRLPAVLGGSLAVGVAWWLMAPAGRVAQWLVALLTAPSFFLVNYASEARGYGVLMLCVLASLWSVVHYQAAGARGDGRGARRALLAFWSAAALGLMAHASYGATLGALAVWSAVGAVRDRQAWPAAARRLAWLYGPPAAFAVWLSAVSLLDVTSGGGPRMEAWQALAAALSLAVGGPQDGDWVWPLAALVAAALTLEVALLWRARDDKAWLWLATFAVPGLPLAAGVHEHFIYPRFFVGVVLFVMLALAELGARGWQRGGATRLVAGGALALITLGNLGGVARLLEDGRGHPGAAVRWMADHSRRAPIVVASDHAFRHGMTLDFYAPLLHPGQRFQLLVEAPWPAAGPEWILRQDAARDWQPTPALHDADGRSYRLEALYPHAGLSGFTLALYHRVEHGVPR